MLKNLDSMRFIVGRLNTFSPEIGYLPASVFEVAEKIMLSGEYL